jgi:predicted Zn-dependent protease
MLEKIKQSLKNNSEIKAWNVRHVITRGSQQYDLAKTTEAVRQISSEHYTIDVLCDSLDPEGKPSSGVGTVTILPGGEINQTLDQAVLTAQMVHNEPYDFPEPSSLPDVELADKEYTKDPAGSIKNVLVSLKEQTASYPHVRLTAAECFGQEKTTHLVSSKGINAQQNATEIYLQWVYLAGEGEDEIETFVEIYQRRIADLNLEEETTRRAQYTSDLLLAEGPPSQIGPVFVQGSTLASMVAGEVLSGSLIQTLSEGGMKYSGETPWEIGKSIFRGDVKGDSFNIWANRQLSYGMHSNAFDAEGIPAQRIGLIQENKLEAFIADQRFASYLLVTWWTARNESHLRADYCSVIYWMPWRM